MTATAAEAAQAFAEASLRVSLLHDGERRELGAAKPSILWPTAACSTFFAVVALTTPAMPGFVNSLVSGDRSSAVTAAGVDLKGWFETLGLLVTRGRAQLTFPTRASWLATFRPHSF